MLSNCPHCREKSVTTKIYIRKRDGVKTRAFFCINKGCKYRQEVPLNKGIFFHSEKKKLVSV